MTRWPAVLCAFLFVLAACGIPQDDEPQALSTELPTVSTVAPTPEPADAGTTVTVFLLDVNEKMTPVQRDLAVEEVRISDLVNELIADTSDTEKELGLTTALPSGLEFAEAPRIEDETAELNFVAGGLEELGGRELSRALAQIVWTLTATEQIDSVRILIDGLAESWPTDGDDASVLNRDSYRTFDPAFIDVDQPTPESDG